MGKLLDTAQWKEVWQSIRQNKTRALLSMLTVSFSIILFTLLFGMVRGLGNTFQTKFTDDLPNGIEIDLWKTSKPYKGYKKDRMLILTKDILQSFYEKHRHHIKRISWYKNYHGYVTHNTHNGFYDVIGTTPDEQHFAKFISTQGRFINNWDLKATRKVAVIGDLAKKELFGNQNALGKWINLNDIPHKVVGIFTHKDDDNDRRLIITPVTTNQKILKNSIVLDSRFIIEYDPNSNAEATKKLMTQIEIDLKDLLEVHPKDDAAIYLEDTGEDGKQFNKFLSILFIASVVIGGGTLISGVVSISNIMLLSVKERSKEIGIRKSIGAKPHDIVLMIINEALFITSLSGLLGLVIGSLLTYSIGDAFTDYGITNPEINLALVGMVTVVITLSGLIASYLPAYKAANIKPIVALKN